MSMRPRASVEISAQTGLGVQASCPSGTRVTRVRDALGPLFGDEEFAGWLAAEGRNAVAPGLLSMVCVLQAMEDLTDRDAADAVRDPAGLEVHAGLALDDTGFHYDDTGFHYSVLSEFRDRLAVDERGSACWS